jgi:hypothetical protein
LYILNGSPLFPVRRARKKQFANKTRAMEICVITFKVSVDNVAGTEDKSTAAMAKTKLVTAAMKKSFIVVKSSEKEFAHIVRKANRQM